MTSSKKESSAELNSVPLPPPDARVINTVCDYCIVGCSQKAIVWPVGEQGGVKAKDNAYGVDFPVEQLTGQWVSPNQHSYCLVDGKKHHVVVHPDDSATVVNTFGNHSIRGGCIAKKVYDPEGMTKDRLQKPLLRVGGRLVPVSWDLALDVMVEVSRHVMDKFGEAAWGMKTFSYQYFENTYAISKLAFESIQTPAYAPHDKPGPGNDTAGADDAGFQVFSASYDDWAKSEVIFISGCDPYETKTVLFTEWMMGANRKLILVLPRKTTGAAYAEKNGGLFLQIIPGTDTILHLAMIRLILENGWEDKAFIDKWVANRWEIDAGFGRGTRNTPWQWRTTWGKFGAAPDEYRKWILSNPDAELESAAQDYGHPCREDPPSCRNDCSASGRSTPQDLLCSGKRELLEQQLSEYRVVRHVGTIVRCGESRGTGVLSTRWTSARVVRSRFVSPYSFAGKGAGRRRKEIDLDRWVAAGKLRFAWVIGTTWIQSMAVSQELEKSFRRLTRESQHQIQEADAGHAADVLKRRADEGGMVVVDQDIYLRQPIGGEFADIVLPVATWGEHDFTRANGERRLRLYGKFCDPPGEAKPDWWVIAQFARKMGFKDYDWKDSNDVFEQAARSGRRGVLNYHPLVVYAKKAGMTGHELLRKLGSTGIQTPVRYRTQLTESDEYREYAGFYNHPEVRGAIIGTKRLHDVDTPMGDPEGPTVMMKWMSAFNTHSGKGILHKTPWELFADFYARITPRNDEFWVTSGRINEIWQTYFDDFRKKFIHDRWPEQWVEVHPVDAARLGIESGDWVRVVNDDVLVQTGGFVAVEPDDQSFSRLLEKGLIRVGRGEFKGVALVTDAVRPGVLWTNSLHPGSPANSVVHRVPDPITNRYRFKLGKGKLERIGESQYKKDLRQMSFAPRTII